MLKFNPTTGQFADDAAADPTAAPVDPSAADAGAPPALNAAPTSTGGGAAPTPAIPPMIAKPAVPPAEPLPGAALGLKPAEQTIKSPESEQSGKVVSPQMKAQDAKVADAVTQGQAALELEAKNKLAQASIDQDKLDIDATNKRRETQEAAARLDAANRAHAAAEAQAKADQDAYQAAASHPATRKEFWAAQDTGTKKSWALSLMFGHIAEAFGGESPGAKLLDKSMNDWVDTRGKQLAGLAAKAEKSGGLLADFWRQHGAEALAQKGLQDAAGYMQVADDINKMNTKMRGLIPDTAIAANAQKAAEYQQKAVDARQTVVDSRAQTSKVTSGGGQLTLKAPEGAKPGNNLLVPDSQGNLVPVASESEAQKGRDSAGRLQNVRDVGQQLIAFRQANPGAFGEVPSHGKPAREATDLEASFVKALSEASGDTSARNIAAIQKRFEAGFFSDNAEATDEIARVIKETEKAHDAGVNATGLRPQKPITAPAPKGGKGGGDRRGTVAGKPAIIHTDGTYTAL